MNNFIYWVLYHVKSEMTIQYKNNLEKTKIYVFYLSGIMQYNQNMPEKMTIICAELLKRCKENFCWH